MAEVAKRVESDRMHGTWLGEGERPERIEGGGVDRLIEAALKRQS